MIKHCCVLLILICLHSVTGHEIQHTALSFKKDNTSYILLEKDTSPLSKSFSVCSWVKRGRNEDYNQYWISYGVSQDLYEFGIADSGYSYLHNRATSFTQPTLTTGEWHHICKTWSFSTRMKYVYYDGEVIGSKSTPRRRRFHLPGTFVLGQLLERPGVENIEESYYFGGTLYDTNIFSIQLTTSQVREIFNQGRCGNYSKNFGEVIFIGWSEILLQDRSGSVEDVELEECDTDHVHPQKEGDEEEGEEEETIRNCSTWQFLGQERFFNKEITVELIQNITKQLQLLGEFRNHSIDDSLIDHLKINHPNQPAINKTNEETEEDAEETTDWDFLTEIYFYKKIVTEELLLAFTDSLDLLAEFIGHSCDEALIRHLNKHHSDCESELTR